MAEPVPHRVVGRFSKTRQLSAVTRDPAAPPAVLGMCGVAMFHNRFVMCCGGSLHGSHAPTNKFYCYDLKRSKWLNIEANNVSEVEAGKNQATLLPIPLVGHAMAAHGSSAWVVGGMSESSLLRSFLHFRFNFAESALTTQGPESVQLVGLESYPSGFPAVFAATAQLQLPTTHAQLMLVIGGLTATKGSSALSYTNRIFALNLEEVSVHRVLQGGTAPTPRAGAAACILPEAGGPRIALYGGRDSRGVLHDLYIGSVTCDEALGGMMVLWSAFSPRSEADVWPGPRLGHCMVYSAPYVALSGGVVEDEKPQEGGHAEKGTHKVFILSCSGSSCAWSQVGPSIARCFHQVLNVDGGLILAGGSKSMFLRSAPAEFGAIRVAVPDISVVQLSIVLENFAPETTGNGASARIELQISRNELSLDRIKSALLRRARVSYDPEDVLLCCRTRTAELLPLHVPTALDKAIAECDSEASIEITASVDIPPQNYTFLRPVGRGSFGEVFIALNESDGSLFAVKVVEVISDERLEALRKEIRMMRQLKHPNIVQYLGSRLAEGRMHIFMDYIAGGDTLEKLCRKCVLPIRAVQMYTRQMLHALCFLHEQGIVHRDIKGANVLLNVGGVVKLSDFGTAKHLKSSALSSSNSAAGTALFMAPEVMRNEPYGTAVDIWSLGCLVIELVSGKYPYEDMGFTSIMQIVFHVTQRGEAPPIPDRMPPNGVHFLQRCFRTDPSMRPTAATLLTDPFIVDLEAEGIRPPRSTPKPERAERSSNNVRVPPPPTDQQQTKGTTPAKPAKLMKRLPKS